MANESEAGPLVFGVETTFDLQKLAASFSQSNMRWTIVEAILALLLSAASAKGATTPESEIELQALARTSRVLKVLTPAQLADINTKISQQMRNSNTELQEVCQALPPDMRLTVFAQCAGIILADGDLMAPEATFLNRISTFLELKQAEAQRVLEVMMIRHKY